MIGNTLPVFAAELDFEPILRNYDKSHVGNEDGKEFDGKDGYYYYGGVTSYFVDGRQLEYEEDYHAWVYDPIVSAPLGNDPDSYFISAEYTPRVQKELDVPDINESRVYIPPEDGTIDPIDTTEEYSTNETSEEDLTEDTSEEYSESYHEETYTENLEDYTEEVNPNVLSRNMGQYSIYIEDNSGLLTEGEAKQLTEYMEPITDYGNAIFVTDATSSAEATAREYYRKYSGTDSGVIFLIDMGCREIYIFSDGEINKKMGETYAIGITDNVYGYATDAKYFECAKETFKEIETVLSVGTVFIPMRYINNFFLAFAISLVIVYFIAVIPRRVYAGNNSAESSEAKKRLDFAKRTELSFTNVSKVLHDVYYSSSSDSGGGGFSSGGGSFSSSGGSSSSGSGGGHGF